MVGLGGQKKKIEKHRVEEGKETIKKTLGQALKWKIFIRTTSPNLVNFTNFSTSRN